MTCLLAEDPGRVRILNTVVKQLYIMIIEQLETHSDGERSRWEWSVDVIIRDRNAEQ